MSLLSRGTILPASCYVSHIEIILTTTKQQQRNEKKEKWEKKRVKMIIKKKDQEENGRVLHKGCTSIHLIKFSWHIFSNFNMNINHQGLGRIICIPITHPRSFASEILMLS